MNLLSQLLEVPATDPGDARRRKLLNILLVGIAVLMVLLVLVTAIASLTGALGQEYTGIVLLRRGSLGSPRAVYHRHPRPRRPHHHQQGGEPG